MRFLFADPSGDQLEAIGNAWRDQGLRPPVTQVVSARSPFVAEIETSSAPPIPADRMESLLKTLRPDGFAPRICHSSGSGLLALDMDSTLIEQEGIDELARIWGVFDQCSEITREAMEGRLDFEQSLRRRCGLLRGAPSSILDQAAERLSLTPGAKDLIGTARKKRFSTLLVSGGFVELGRPLVQRLSIDRFFANRLEVADGRLSGRLNGPIIDAEAKRECLRDACRQEGLDADSAIAIGDGANDLLMLEWAGLGVAFDAKPCVRRRAGAFLNVRRLDWIPLLTGLWLTALAVAAPGKEDQR